MKIAIIGKNSYIGRAFLSAFSKYSEVIATEVDARDDAWRSFDFSTYDAVIHVAAIVHRKDISDPDIYRIVNTELPTAVASTAKKAGVKHFVFLSSMSVFGKHKSITSWELIGNENYDSKTPYGQSKRQAELNLQELADDHFTVSIVRPPSVYGKGCKGSLFDIYTKLALATPIIPIAAQHVKQGMVHIDNLCACVCEIVFNCKGGTFHPQDADLLSVGEILCCIRAAHGKKSYPSHIAGKLLSLFRWSTLYMKFYGAVTYSENLVLRDELSYVRLTTKTGIDRSY